MVVPKVLLIENCLCVLDNKDSFTTTERRLGTRRSKRSEQISLFPTLIFAAKGRSSFRSNPVQIFILRHGEVSGNRMIKFSFIQIETVFFPCIRNDLRKGKAVQSAHRHPFAHPQTRLHGRRRIGLTNHLPGMLRRVKGFGGHPE